MVEGGKGFEDGCLRMLVALVTVNVLLGGGVALVFILVYTKYLHGAEAVRNSVQQ